MGTPQLWSRASLSQQCQAGDAWSKGQKEPCPSLPIPLLQSDDLRNLTAPPWLNAQQFRVFPALISPKHQPLGAEKLGCSSLGPGAFIPSKSFICCHPLAWLCCLCCWAWLGMAGHHWAWLSSAAPAPPSLPTPPLQLLIFLTMLALILTPAKSTCYFPQKAET